MRLKFALLVIVVFRLTPSLVAKENKLEKVRGMVARAVALTDVRRSDLPPLRMHARIRLVNGPNSVIEGTFLLQWISTDHWRWEIQLGPYTEVQVRVGSTRWVKSTLGYQPLLVAKALTLLAPVQISLDPEDRIAELKEREIQGRSSRCARIVWRRSWAEWCFDDQNGALVEVNYRNARWTYNDYQPIGDKMFPHVLRYSTGEALGVEVLVDEMARDRGITPTLLQQPVGAETWEDCDNPVAAKAVANSSPDLDKLAFKYLAVGTQADIIVEGVVETDGHFDRINVLQTGGPDLDKATVDVLSRWRFQPAVCGDHPIRTHAQVHVVYSHKSLPGSNCFGINCNAAPLRQTWMYIVSSGEWRWIP